MGFMLLSHKAVTKFGGGGATKPDATNTGPRSSATTTISGDYTLSTGSISRYHITGDLYLAGPNVTATDCLVDGAILFNSAPGGNYGNPNPWGNQTANYCRTGHLDSRGVDVALVDHTHVDGSLAGPGTLAAFLNPATKNQFLTIQNSLFDNPASVGAAPIGTYHLEALHITDCTTCTLRNNVFNWNADSPSLAQTTAAVNIDSGANNHFTVDGNWFYSTGAPYLAYLYLGGVPSTVTNNQFFSPSAGQYPSYSGTLFTASGNTYDGSPYTLPYNN